MFMHKKTKVLLHIVGWTLLIRSRSSRLKIMNAMCLRQQKPWDIKKIGWTTRNTSGGSIEVIPYNTGCRWSRYMPTNSSIQFILTILWTGLALHKSTSIYIIYVK